MAPAGLIIPKVRLWLVCSSTDVAAAAQVDALVTQGCRPLGPLATVTRVREDGWLIEIDGQPALPQVCLWTLSSLSLHTHISLRVCMGMGCL